MKSFTVNGVKYTAKEFSYNVICDLEEMGVQLSDFGTKPMSMVRAYLSICAGKDADFAGKEIEEHIIKGGSLEDIMNAISDAMDKSGFFQALNSRTESNTTEGTETEKSEKK